MVEPEEIETRAESLAAAFALHHEPERVRVPALTPRKAPFRTRGAKEQEFIRGEPRSLDPFKELEAAVKAKDQSGTVMLKGEGANATYHTLGRGCSKVS